MGCMFWIYLEEEGIAVIKHTVDDHKGVYG